MLITKDAIKHCQPCAAAYIEVLEKYGNKFEVSFEKLIKDFPKYASWIQSNLGCYRAALAPNYTGRFRVGQIIFRQRYGIGDFQRSRIHRIAENASGVGFNLEVTANRDMQGDVFNIILEAEAFDTFGQLKDHWIREICNLSESHV